MSLRAAAGRIGATVLAMVQTRLALAAVEIEEESQRLLGYFVMALLALILFGMAMMLVALTIVLIFWDSYRLQAAGGLAVAFGAASALVAFKLKASIASRPPLMAATVAELNKDVNFIRNVGREHE